MFIEADAKMMMKNDRSEWEKSGGVSQATIRRKAKLHGNVISNASTVLIELCSISSRYGTVKKTTEKQ
jgi:hypothetical protein